MQPTTQKRNDKSFIEFVTMRLLTLIFCFAAVLPIGINGIAAPHGRTYYVSGNEPSGGIHAGRDENAGTLDRPFATIGKAAKVAHAGDTILIRGGIYRETVHTAVSGSANNPITFAPYRDERVEIRGTDAILAGEWKPDDSGSLWTAPWPKTAEYNSDNNQSDFVMIGGIPVSVCRWPAAPQSDALRPGGARIEKVLSCDKTDKHSVGPGYTIYRTTFQDSHFDEPDGRWKGAKIWIAACNANDTHDGDGQTGIVLETNRTDHTITIELPSSAKIGTETPGNFQFGTNCEYHLFDPIGMDSLPIKGVRPFFWHDVPHHMLYVRLPSDKDKPTGIEVKRRDWGFNLDNRSYVTIKNMILTACSITTDSKAGDGRGNGNGRGSADFLAKGVASAHHIVLDRIHADWVCHFTDQGGNLQTQWDTSSGVIVSGSDCIIRNSVIGHSSGCGLVLIGRRNRAVDCIVHDTNTGVTDGGGIGLGVRPWTTTEDCEVAFCTVYNTGIDGIEFGALKNSDPTHEGVARIHHCMVHDTVLRSADSGGLHTFSSDGQWTRIDHNVVYNTGGIKSGYQFFGIYLDYAPDEGKKPARYIVDHNVVYETASSLNINHAHTNRIFNNTLISSTEVARTGISSNGGEFTDVIIANNVGNTPYRGVGNGAKRIGNREDIKPDSTFIDALNPNRIQRDYRPKQSLGRGESFAPFDDSEVVELGAYVAGRPKWAAGARIRETR